MVSETSAICTPLFYLWGQSTTYGGWFGEYTTFWRMMPHPWRSLSPNWSLSCTYHQVVLYSICFWVIAWSHAHHHISFAVKWMWCGRSYIWVKYSVSLAGQDTPSPTVSWGMCQYHGASEINMLSPEGPNFMKLFLFSFHWNLHSQSPDLSLLSWGKQSSKLVCAHRLITNLYEALEMVPLNQAHGS